jgi:capsular polysaccharide export protein
VDGEAQTLNRRAGQTFLFLQGPLSPFFPRLAAALEARGHRALRVNLCLGDQLLWRRPGALNYRGDLRGWPRFVGDLLQREGVTDLVLLGEQRPHHLAAITEAKAAGVRVTVTDFGYLRPDWITLERDGMSAWSRFPRDPAAIVKLAADSPPPDPALRYVDSFGRQAFWDVTYHLTNWLFAWLFPGYRSPQIHHPVPNYLGTGWRLLQRRSNGRRAARIVEAAQSSGRPYWVFAMQMEVDYSIRAYSPYRDMSGPLQEVIESFARFAPPEGRLLVKVHPLDPGLRGWRSRIARMAAQAGVRDRTDFLDGGALDPLVARSSGVVTVNSTAALRALQIGTPVKVLGSAIYDVEGLTFQGSLHRFWTEAAPPDPALLDAFLRSIADLLHIRGVYYREPGLSAAVAAAAERLEAPASEAVAARLSRAVDAAPAKSLGEEVIRAAPQHRIARRPSRSE